MTTVKVTLWNKMHHHGNSFMCTGTNKHTHISSQHDNLIATSVPNKATHRVKITFILAVHKQPRATAQTHLHLLPERFRLHQEERDYWSIKLRGLLLETEKPAFPPELQIKKHWFAPLSTTLLPRRRHTHLAKIRLRWTQGEQIRKTGIFHWANSSCEDRVPALQRPWDAHLNKYTGDHVVVVAPCCHCVPYEPHRHFALHAAFKAVITEQHQEVFMFYKNISLVIILYISFAK